MSAWSSTPPDDGKYASVHAAPSGTRSFSSCVTGSSWVTGSSATAVAAGAPLAAMVSMTAAAIAGAVLVGLVRGLIERPP
jgi:hypothetical protein